MNIQVLEYHDGSRLRFISQFYLFSFVFLFMYLILSIILAIVEETFFLKGLCTTNRRGILGCSTTTTVLLGPCFKRYIYSSPLSSLISFQFIHVYVSHDMLLNQGARLCLAVPQCSGINDCTDGDGRRESLGIYVNYFET